MSVRQPENAILIMVERLNMGLSIGIDIKLYANTPEYEITQLDVLKIFQKSQWKFSNTQGQQTYLPLHDNESYDWNYGNFCNKYLFDIFELKAKAKEIIGVRLFWEDSDVGVDLLLYPNLTMIFSIERGNRPVTHYGITDFDWFLSRIIPLFNKTDFIGIEYIEFMEHS